MTGKIKCKMHLGTRSDVCNWINDPKNNVGKVTSILEGPDQWYIFYYESDGNHTKRKIRCWTYHDTYMYVCDKINDPNSDIKEVVTVTGRTGWHIFYYEDN